jgi:hypothetical protein
VREGPPAIVYTYAVKCKQATLTFGSLGNDMVGAIGDQHHLVPASRHDGHKRDITPRHVIARQAGANARIHTNRASQISNGVDKTPPLSAFGL